MPGPPHERDAPPKEVEAFRTAQLRLTTAAGFGGLPQVTLPAVRREREGLLLRCSLFVACFLRLQIFLAKKRLIFSFGFSLTAGASIAPRVESTPRLTFPVHSFHSCCDYELRTRNNVALYVRGTVGGKPVGLSVVGAKGSDEALLALVCDVAAAAAAAAAGAEAGAGAGGAR